MWPAKRPLATCRSSVAEHCPPEHIYFAHYTPAAAAAPVAGTTIRRLRLGGPED